MDTILQELLDLAGVGAAMVFDGTGHLAGHRGRAVYDRALCEQVSGNLVKAIDSIQLQQADWDSVTAQFADGKIILRNLGSPGGHAHMLAVVADVTLNSSFATVAIRVAANKLRKAIVEGGTAPAAVALPAAAAAGAPSASSSQLPGESKPALGSSGLSWSKVSSVGFSTVAVADPASSAFLTRCAKQLARHVGPIAKVYVEEAVRRVSPDAPFSVSIGARLVEDLATQIEDADDRAQFLGAIEKV
ncbi:MAG TPA: hypothetical protein VF400_05360 [Anaeromyxobacteraceae bacterium]